MNPHSITDIVLACERKRCQALLAGDVDTLGTLLSERLIFTHANATHDSKASLIAKMRLGTIVYKSLTIDQETVIELPDAAILSSRLQAVVDVAGTTKTIRNSTLSVWSKEADEWRLVAYQPTPIAT